MGQFYPVRDDSRSAKYQTCCRVCFELVCTAQSFGVAEMSYLTWSLQCEQDDHTITIAPNDAHFGDMT